MVEGDGKKSSLHCLHMPNASGYLLQPAPHGLNVPVLERQRSRFSHDKDWSATVQLATSLLLSMARGFDLSTWFRPDVFCAWCMGISTNPLGDSFRQCHPDRALAVGSFLAVSGPFALPNWPQAHHLP